MLAKNGVRGLEGRTLLAYDNEEENEEEEEAREEPAPAGDVPQRKVYCLDLKATTRAEAFLKEIRRIVAENNVQTVSLASWIQGKPKQEQLDRYLNPEQHQVPPVLQPAPSLPVVAQPATVQRIEENTGRRWYPVIDYSRCTNCMECLDFCLFGVYGVDKLDSILVEQADNCKKGCPACSRVCPENAILFPQHKTPAIAGSPSAPELGGLKIDLSQLFGAPSAVEVAAMERDRELVADGREAVGMSVGIPKRQADKKADEPRDALDDLVDEFDKLDI